MVFGVGNRVKKGGKMRLSNKETPSVKIKENRLFWRLSKDD